MVQLCRPRIVRGYVPNLPTYLLTSCRWLHRVITESISPGDATRHRVPPVCGGWHRRRGASKRKAMRITRRRSQSRPPPLFFLSLAALATHKRHVRMVCRKGHGGDSCQPEGQASRGNLDPPPSIPSTSGRQPAAAKLEGRPPTVTRCSAAAVPPFFRLPRLSLWAGYASFHV